MNEIKEEYKSASPAEFFYKYREIAGFANPVRAMYQTIKELVENALDATDVHGILPDVKITVRKVDEAQDFYCITVEDNGIGIPPNIVPYAFGKVLFSSKYVLRQSRGMYGLGVKMAVLYAQMTSGRPIEVITSKTNYKRIYMFKIRIDVNRNEPVVIEAGSWRKSREWHGTIVSITIEGDWNRAKPRILEYLYRTSIALPYANIVLVTPENEIIYHPRVTNTMPKPPIETRPHPLGIDLEFLNDIIKNKKYSTIEELLVKSFQSIGSITAKTILQAANIPPDKNPRELVNDELLSLVNSIKTYNKYKPPSPNSLSPLGVEVIKTGLMRAFNPEFVTVVTRKPGSHGGHPFIVEIGIAYGGKTPIGEDYPVILRYANKIPLLYDEGTDVITQVVKEEISWDNYNIKFPEAIAILVHLCSTKIPFKGVGKESIAGVPDINREIKLGIMEAFRELKKYLVKKAKEREALERAEIIAKYIPEVARSLATILASPENIEHVKLRENLVTRLASIVSKKTGIPIDLIENIVKSVEEST